MDVAPAENLARPARPDRPVPRDPGPYLAGEGPRWLAASVALGIARSRPSFGPNFPFVYADVGAARGGRGMMNRTLVHVLILAGAGVATYIVSWGLETGESAEHAPVVVTIPARKSDPPNHGRSA